MCRSKSTPYTGKQSLHICAIGIRVRYYTALVGITLAIGLTACAMPGGRFHRTATIPVGIDRSQAAEATIRVLQEHGYAPSIVNQRVGTITTDWRSNDGWFAFVSGHRVRDRVTITIGDSTVTLTGESQAREGQSFFFRDEHSVDTDWFGAAASDDVKAEWERIREQLVAEISGLPQSLDSTDERLVAAKPSRASFVPLMSGFSPTERIRVAVVDFVGIGVEESDVRILTDRLRAELVDTGRFTVIERERMNEILEEQGFQQTLVCATDACAIELGRLTGASGIVAGTVGKLGATYTVTVRLINVETGEIIARASEDCACAVDDLLGSMHRLSLLLAQRTE